MQGLLMLECREMGARQGGVAACILLFASCYDLFHKGRVPMAIVEKISIVLPPEMIAIVRQVVETGEYASSSEVVRDALREWAQTRSRRQQDLDELRKLRRQALEDKTPGVPVDEVLARLERKYQALADAAR